MTNVVAIVQARMGSSRLPGKSMMLINKIPMIQYVINQLEKCSLINKTILAVPDTPENEELAKFVISQGVEVFRGSNEDVLDRYYQAAKRTCADTVVRITGDCPLLDASICDDLIHFFKDRALDYAYLSPTFAEGLDCEVFSFKALEKAFNESTRAPHREHVTLFFSDNETKFRIGEMENSVDESQYRITVDNEEDFQVVSKVLEYLSENNMSITFKNIKNFLDSNPQITKLNKDIIRNEGLMLSLQRERESE